MSELEPVADPVGDDRDGPGPAASRGAGSRWARRGVWLAAIALTVALIVLLAGTPVAATVVAVLAGLLILRIGWFFLQSFATPPPEPPESGKLRKVKLTYRCSICGAEVRMTVADSEDPEPPRHCLEDMDLVAPID